MSPAEKTYFHQKISTLRKGLQMLEEELGEYSEPVRRKGLKQIIHEACVNQYEKGDRRIHEAFKKQKKTDLKTKCTSY